MRILGIDIGSKSIKAVELDSAFGRYEIHEYHESPVDPQNPDPLQAQAQAVARLIQSLPKKPDRVAASMRSSEITFRNLQVPTRDKKGILAGVRFELEDELPFSPEDSVFDYAILSQSKQVGTSLHVAATLSRLVASRLVHFQNGGVDPDLLTTESWAYRGLLNRVLNPAAQESPVLVADIGHERTVLYLHWKSGPALTREIAWGGRDLTLAIAQKLQIPLEQAEQIKMGQGVAQTPDQIREIIKQSLPSLITDFRQVLLSCKNMTHLQPSAIFLCGGTSLAPGLSEHLETTLKIPVQRLQALSSITTSGVTYSDHTDAAFVLASSLALSLVGSDRNANINFRKGEFGKIGQSREINWATFKKPMMAVGAILSCMIVSLSVESMIYKKKLEETDKALEKAVRGFFNVSGSALRNYMASTTTLRNSINKELNKQRDLAKLAGPNPHSPIDFMKDLSGSIKKDVVVDLTNFQVGAAPTANYNAKEETSATLSFLVANPQMAEKLKTVVSGKLQGAPAPKTEETTLPDGSKRWKVTFSGKVMESAYGK